MATAAGNWRSSAEWPLAWEPRVGGSNPSECTLYRSVERLGERRPLLNVLNQLRREMDPPGQFAGTDTFQQQAWVILSSPATRAASDLNAEPRSIRERYGSMTAFDPATSNGYGAPAWASASHSRGDWSKLACVWCLSTFVGGDTLGTQLSCHVTQEATAFETPSSQVKKGRFPCVA